MVGPANGRGGRGPRVTTQVANETNGELLLITTVFDNQPKNTPKRGAAFDADKEDHQP